MLSGVALDNLSPFQIDDAPEAYYFHRFYGGWSMEGKLIIRKMRARMTQSVIMKKVR